MTRRERRRFTISQLKEFDGREGKPAYTVFKGKVYDVSNSGLWKDGKHQGRHSAGDDLTESIMNAPHGEEVFMKFPLVGELSLEKPLKKKLVQGIQRLHLHPILVHFSIAYSIVVSLLSLLYILTGEGSFEIASYYLLLLGFLAAPAAGLSGFFSWKVTYEGRMTKIFSRKITFTVVLIILTTISFVWRTLDPNVLLARTALSFIYLALIFSMTPTAMILGYHGGKIVYP